MGAVGATLISANSGKSRRTAELLPNCIDIAWTETAPLAGAAELAGIAALARDRAKVLGRAAELLLQKFVKIACAITAAIVGATFLAVGAALAWIGGTGKV
jgi:hypothetical protein